MYLEAAIEEAKLIFAISKALHLEPSNTTESGSLMAASELKEQIVNLKELPEGITLTDDLLDSLMAQNQYAYRRVAAMYGRDTDLDILVVDRNPLVRFEVLWHKREKDLKVMLDDTDTHIREAATAFLNSNLTANGILGKH